MMTIMVGVSVMVGLAIVATSILWVPAILDAFAKKNFIVTQIREGTSKVIVIFGKFHHAALSYIGHYFNREYDLINEAERDEYTARLEAAKTGLSNGDKEPAKSLLIGKGWLIDEAKARESIANVEAAQTSLSDGDDGPARTLLMEKGRLEETAKTAEVRLVLANLLSEKKAQLEANIAKLSAVNGISDLLSEEEKAEAKHNEPAKHSWIDSILPGGLRCVGLPFIFDVHWYKFRWTSLRQGGSPTTTNTPTEKGEMSTVKEEYLTDLFIARDERIDYVNLMDDVYVFKMERAEDKEMIPLSFRVLLTARIVNPYKALFRTEQWLEMTINTLRPIIKQYVGRKTFQQLVLERKESLEHEADEILNLPANPSAKATIKNYIRDRWGVQIKKIGIVNINTAGKAGEAYEEATAKQYLADQEAKRIVTIANADATQIGILAEAEANRIKTVMTQMKEQGEDAYALRSIEAFEKAGVNGNTVLIGGAQPVQMLLNASKKATKEGEE